MENLKEKGNLAEQAVVNYLVKKGYNIAQKNYTLPFGEIDLIAYNLWTIAFVEVKMRTRITFPLSLVVNSAKQKKISRVAQHYLSHLDHLDKECRFDVALVTFNNDWQIEYLENAFEAIE